MPRKPFKKAGKKSSPANSRNHKANNSINRRKMRRPKNSAGKGRKK